MKLWKKWKYEDAKEMAYHRGRWFWGRKRPVWSVIRFDPRALPKAHRSNIGWFRQKQQDKARAPMHQTEDMWIVGETTEWLFHPDDKKFNDDSLFESKDDGETLEQKVMDVPGHYEIERRSFWGYQKYLFDDYKRYIKDVHKEIDGKKVKVHSKGDIMEYEENVYYDKDVYRWVKHHKKKRIHKEGDIKHKIGDKVLNDQKRLVLRVFKNKWLKDKKKWHWEPGEWLASLEEMTGNAASNSRSAKKTCLNCKVVIPNYHGGVTDIIEHGRRFPYYVVGGRDFYFEHELKKDDKRYYEVIDIDEQRITIGKDFWGYGWYEGERIVAHIDHRVLNFGGVYFIHIYEKKLAEDPNFRMMLYLFAGMLTKYSEMKKTVKKRLKRINEGEPYEISHAEWRLLQNPRKRLW